MHIPDDDDDNDPVEIERSTKGKSDKRLFIIDCAICCIK
jgi:hypothetical protein